MTLGTTDSTQSRNGYSEVNGIKMYYEMHGDSGEYLVLIHGGGSTINTTFGKILPLLAKNFRVIAMELQAHGRTGDRNAPESFEQDADDVAMLLKNLGIQKALLLGFSNGGNTAMQVTMRHPDIVNRLIIASSFYKRNGMMPGFFEGMAGATLDVMPQALKDAFLKVNPDSNKLLNMFNKDKQRMLDFKDWADDALRSIKVPTLIISGDKDVMVSEHAVAMSRLIPNSRLVILPAYHGEYMGVAESPDPGMATIEVTSSLIEGFLNKLQ